MADITTTGYTQAPVGARLPRFLTSNAPTGGATPTYGADQYSGAPVGGAGVDPAQIQQQLQSPNVADRFRAVSAITNLPPAQALPLLDFAAQNDNAQVRDLANQAKSVMARMPGATPQQPAGPQNQPQYQPQQPQYQPQQPQYQPQQPQAQPYNPGPAYQPTVVQPAQYTPAAVGPMSPDDANFMIQTLTPDLAYGEEKATPAIRQMMGIAQQNPAAKEMVFNILLNHIYSKYDGSVTEAIKALASMNDPRALPYIEAIQRTPGYAPQTHDAAVAAVQQMRLSQGGQPGTASVNGGASVEYIRAMEVELRQGGDAGMAAFQQIRNALGPDPRAQSPIRQEVVRVLLTHVASSQSPNTVAACCQLLGAMGAREMDCLRYLDAVKRSPSHSPQARDAAAAAIQQIMQAPAR